MGIGSGGIVCVGKYLKSENLDVKESENLHRAYGSLLIVTYNGLHGGTHTRRLHHLKAICFSLPNSHGNKQAGSSVAGTSSKVVGNKSEQVLCDSGLTELWREATTINNEAGGDADLLLYKESDKKGLCKDGFYFSAYWELHF
ncbi:hypothetical protein Tco_0098206 [Tanacetum coccineum]